MENTVSLVGLTGRQFIFTAYEYRGAWNPTPALYAFASYTLLGSWGILYIGQAGDIKARMTNHERWLEAAGFGASYVLARAASWSEITRKDEEKDLIAAYQPPMNTQHRNYLAEALTQASVPGAVPLGLGALGHYGKGLGGR